MLNHRTVWIGVIFALSSSFLGRAAEKKEVFPEPTYVTIHVPDHKPITVDRKSRFFRELVKSARAIVESETGDALRWPGYSTEQMSSNLKDKLTAPAMELFFDPPQHVRTNRKHFKGEENPLVKSILFSDTFPPQYSKTGAYIGNYFFMQRTTGTAGAAIGYMPYVSKRDRGALQRLVEELLKSDGNEKKAKK